MSKLEFRPDVRYALFGAEDAEYEAPERLREYFYRNRAYDALLADLPIRVLVGHKGVGKSALLKMAHLEDIESGVPSIWLRPADFASLNDTYDERFDKATVGWERGILSVLFQRIMSIVVGQNNYQTDSLLVSSTKDLFATIKKLGEKHIGLSTSHSEQALTRKLLESKRIYVYIDDLDMGWKGTKSEIRRISALITALRAICGDFRGIQFRIELRTDVYHLVRTSDESTDKISQYIVPLIWTNYDILICMAKRISTYFGKVEDDSYLRSLPQNQVAERLHGIIDSRFNDVGKWQNAPIHRVLFSLTRRRPRDTVKLLSSSAEAAFLNRHDKILTEDLKSIFPAYSQERLQDIINEFSSEMPNVKALLLGMRATKERWKEPHPFLFTNDQLSTRLKNIMSSNRIIFANNEFVDGHSLKQFLYKIDFIVARQVDKTGWVRWTYFDENKFAASREADYGYSWEVHPAYRWALQREDVQAIIDNTDLGSD